jgi:hypothetical protein
MFFNTTVLSNTFFTIVFKNNPLESAKVNIFGVPGYVAGSLICYFYYKRFMNFMPLAATACILFIVSNIGMYFITTSVVSPSNIFWPVFFRAAATIITYISVGIYITSNIPFKFFNDVTMFLIAIRTLLVPIIASTLYSNLFYHWQIKYLNVLADHTDLMKSFDKVPQSSKFFPAFKEQASLLALRDIYGALIICGIVLLVIIIVTPFHGSHKRMIFNWRDPLHGKEVAQSIAV